MLTGKGTKHVSMLTGILMYTPGMWSDRAG